MRIVKNVFRPSALMLCAALAVAGCGKDEVASGDMLAYVPANTPFVFANIETVPNPVLDAWINRALPIYPLWIGMMDEALAKDTDQQEMALRIARALLDEVRDRNSREKWRELGFKVDARFALYGNGLVPVMRLELDDPTKFQALVARIETKVGSALGKGEVEGQAYWLLGDEKVQGLMAVAGQHLVLTVAPKGASAELLKRLLGTKMPEASLANDNRIARMNDDHGFLAYGSGYMDVAAILDAYYAAQAGSEPEFMAAFEGKATTPDPVCQQEFKSIAAKFPRIALGYRAMTEARQDSALIFELESSLAKAVAATAAPVPGLGAETSALLDFGLGFDILKAKQFWLDQAKAVAAAPYKCSDLADLNSGFAEMEKSLSNVIPPPASDFRGFRMTLSKFQLVQGAPMPEFSGKLLIAMGDAPTALGMAQMFIPQITELKLAADGLPVEVPASLVPVPAGPIHAALNKGALALSVGEGEQAGLTEYLNAPASNDPTFLAFSYDSAMMTVFGDTMAQMAAAMPAEQASALEKQQEIFKQYPKIMRRAEAKLIATDRGLELYQSVIAP